MRYGEQTRMAPLVTAQANGQHLRQPIKEQLTCCPDTAYHDEVTVKITSADKCATKK